MSWRPAGVDAADATWLRTYGMCQAGLPEMSCTVSSTDDPEAVDGVDTLFASMAPYQLELGRALDVDETLELEHRLWEVVDVPAGAPFAAPSHGIRHHVPCSGARVNELRELREKKATKKKATRKKATKKKATRKKATKKKATKK